MTSHTLKSRAFTEDLAAWGILVSALVGFSLWRGFLSHGVTVELKDPQGARTRWPTILALEYDRVVSDDAALTQGSITISGFDDHLRILNAHGYQAIPLKQVENFYSSRGTLPPKSVLLTFDNAYFTHSSLVTPLLAKARIPAVLTIATDRIESRDTAFLFWDRIREMVGSGLWEIALSGKSMTHKVQTRPNGELGAFHGSRAWNADTDRPETPDEFRKRVRSDYEDALARLRTEVAAARVTTFTAPLGQSWYRDLDPKFAAIDDEERNKRFAMSFSDDLFGTNTRTSNPAILKRHRGTASLTPQALDSWLAGFEAMTAPVGTKGAQPVIFFDTVGTLSKGSIELGRESTEEQRKSVRSPAPQGLEPWTLDFDLTLSDGSEFWLTTRSSVSGREIWRVGISKNSVSVQEISSGKFENLRSVGLQWIDSKTSKVSISLIGAGVSVKLDGEPVFGNPVPVPSNESGDIEFASWASSGSSRASIAKAQILRRPRTFTPFHTAPLRTEIDSLRIDETRASDIVIADWSISHSGIERITRDDDLINMIESRFSARINSALCLDTPANGDWTGVVRRAADVVRSYPRKAFVLALPPDPATATNVKSAVLRELSSESKAYLEMEEVFLGKYADERSMKARIACSKVFTEG